MLIALHCIAKFKKMKNHYNFLEHQSTLCVSGSKLYLAHPAREGQERLLVNQVKYLERKELLKKVKMGLA